MICNPVLNAWVHCIVKTTEEETAITQQKMKDLRNHQVHVGKS